MELSPPGFRPPPYGAIVLAGGAGRRLGGPGKPLLPVGGVPMLARVLAAVDDAVPRVVVGPPHPVPDGVMVVREEPPGGGPVAATAAGVVVLPADLDVVVVLAADLPFLTAGAVTTLRHTLTASGTADGAVYVDADGRRQLLCGAWRVPVLRERLAALSPPDGVAMRALVADLAIVELGGDADSGVQPWFDCDTGAAVEAANAVADQQSRS